MSVDGDESCNYSEATFLTFIEVPLLFNSYSFLFLFLPAVWMLFRIASLFSWSKGAISILFLGSLVFYGYWNPAYLMLILISIIGNYFLGRWISVEKKHRKLITALGIGANLLSIAYFKYAGFLVENINWATNAGIEIGEIVLPLGISFFTFQQIAFLADSYKGEVKEKSFLNYALFVCFFPQLIAGPIVHYKEMMPQFSKESTFRFSYENISAGVIVFGLGLFKKVVIADTLSPWAINLFDGDALPIMADAWIGVMAYTLQIYFDFSGYSDMAIGLGKFFNINIPVNFHSPYKSTSIIDFWRTWHMTLSRFLKDYLYIPLGGNRNGQPRRYVNLMITMVLGGLWHGAAWTFVIWGALHGVYLCINNGWLALGKKFPKLKLNKVVAWALTFLSVSVAWVFFRAPSLERAMQIFEGMIGTHGIGPSAEKYLKLDTTNIMWSVQIDSRLLVLGLLFLLVLLLKPAWQYANYRIQKIHPGFAVMMAICFIISVMYMTRISEFLYFQF